MSSAMFLLLRVAIVVAAVCLGIVVYRHSSAIRNALQSFLTRLAGSLDSLPAIVRGIAIALCVFAGVLVLFWFLVGGAVFGAYSYSFRVFVSHGGMNTWLARAVSLVFAAVVFAALQMAFSFRKNRRRRGWSLLFATAIAFNLLIFFCTRTQNDLPGDRLFDPLGEPLVRYYIDARTGEWSLFPAKVEYHPETGSYMPLIDTAASAAYEGWKRTKADEAGRKRLHDEEKQQQMQKVKVAEHEKQQARKLSEERNAVEAKQKADEESFRQSLVDYASFPKGEHLKETVIVAVDCPESKAITTPRDVICARIAKRLEDEGLKSTSGVFKPAFYRDGYFERVWNREKSLLRSLQLDHAPMILLCKARFGKPTSTDFKGFVSVDGDLTFFLLTPDAQRGPRNARIAGAGSNDTEAAANAAERLVEKMDLAVFIKP